MIKIVLQGLGIFFLIYIFWLFTGGPERGAERHENGESSFFIGLPDGRESTNNQNKDVQ